MKYAMWWQHPKGETWTFHHREMSEEDFQAIMQPYTMRERDAATVSWITKLMVNPSIGLCLMRVVSERPTDEQLAEVEAKERAELFNKYLKPEFRERLMRDVGTVTGCWPDSAHGKTHDRGTVTDFEFKSGNFNMREVDRMCDEHHRYKTALETIFHECKGTDDCKDVAEAALGLSQDFA
jgi:hypothetical protein